MWKERKSTVVEVGLAIHLPTVKLRHLLIRRLLVRDGSGMRRMARLDFGLAGISLLCLPMAMSVSALTLQVIRWMLKRAALSSDWKATAADNLFWPTTKIRIRFILKH